MCGEHHVSPYISVRTRWLLQQRDVWPLWTVLPAVTAATATQILMHTDPALIIHGGLEASTHALTRTRKRNKGSGETVKHNHWYSYDHKRYIFKLTVVATSYAPFLWQMCFSGRPFLYGIQIFFRGFCVSSRGFVAALSSIPSCGEVEVAAAAAGTRGFFPWCCSEVDRCFIRVGVAGWRRHERSFLSFSVPLVTWPDLPIPTTGSWT